MQYVLYLGICIVKLKHNYYFAAKPLLFCQLPKEKF